MDEKNIKKKIDDLLSVTNGLFYDNIEDSSVMRHLYQSLDQLRQELGMEAVEIPHEMILLVKLLARGYRRYKIETDLGETEYEEKIMWARDRGDALRWVEECAERLIGCRVTETKPESFHLSDVIVGDNDTTQQISM